jgi:hypothetical protein
MNVITSTSPSSPDRISKINTTQQSAEDRLLFTCTRQNFTGRHKSTVLDLCSTGKINWETVFLTAQIHGVAPLVFYNLRQCSIETLDVPQNITNAFMRSLMENIHAKELLGSNALKAISIFQENDIDVMLVKGVALDSLVYSQPWFTATSDVDLIIRLKRESVSEARFNEYMLALHHAGVEYDYYEHHDVSMNGVLPVDFDLIWQDAQKISYRGQAAYAMCPEDFLLSVCVNSCRKRYFRLKALLDIAEIINTYPQLDWVKLIERARLFDCTAIVYTALLTTQMTVGCSLPTEVVDELADSPLRFKIIRWISSRLSLAAYASLHSESKFFDRAVNMPLILPYATLRWYQIWRKIKFALLTTYPGQRRINLTNGPFH